MAVPKSKVTRSRRGMRRSHDKLGIVNVVDCPDCGEKKLSHHICKACGYYRNTEITPLREDLDIDDDVA